MNDAHTLSDGFGPSSLLRNWRKAGHGVERGESDVQFDHSCPYNGNKIVVVADGPKRWRCVHADPRTEA